MDQTNILLVEDESGIAEVVKATLEVKGYAVYTAENGKTAFDLFNRYPISLVLLDLMLPDMPGEEICSTLRKKSRVPVIMLTAKAQEEDLLCGLDVGADDYITKPFSLKELTARVEAVLRRSQSDLKPLFGRLSFNGGDLIVDMESRLVLKKGHNAALTKSEMNILLALLKYPSKVFTREELISIAFGEDFDSFDRAIDSHIKNLRQKIETDIKKPVYVITVHGIGYRFGGEDH